MGGVLSAIKIVIGFCWSLRSSLTPVIKRINADPGRPRPNPTKSFWLSHPHADVAKHQSTSLPEEVDVVIIGSGITGTVIAKTLLEPPDGDNYTPLRIAMLDARDACSGATGRNGGHINEGAYLEYESLKKKHGKDTAMEIIRFRLAHLDALLAVAEAEGEEVVKDSQIRRCETAYVCFEEEVWEDSKRKLEIFLEDFEDQRGLWVAHEMEEARKVRTACPTFLFPFVSFSLNPVNSKHDLSFPYLEYQQQPITKLRPHLNISYPMIRCILHHQQSLTLYPIESRPSTSPLTPTPQAANTPSYTPSPQPTAQSPPPPAPSGPTAS